MKTLSLFTGAGGLDIGFHKTGFDIVATLEIDKASCDTLSQNREHYLGQNTKIYNKDITKFEPEELDLEQVDFIIGGPPCQSFSAAGRRAGGVHGINDTRGSLFWYYCKYLAHFKPVGFLFENVKGIVHANKRKDWDLIVNSFENVGYRLCFRVLDAADYGVPQHRERLIMVGVRDDLKIDFKFPGPTHGPLGTQSKSYVTAYEALKDIDDPNEKVPPYGGKYGHLLSDIPPGNNYSFYTEKLGHPNPQFAWRSKFSGFLYKMALNEPSKTIVAHQGKYDGPFHWRNRKLNVEELKRIQSFPDDYQFASSKIETIKQIGNSVAPLMGERLAEAVAVQFFKKNSVEVSLIDHNADLLHAKRKAIKAASTKNKTIKNLKNEFDQMSLFESKQQYKLNFSEKYKIQKGDTEFEIDLKILNGKWTINVREIISKKKYDFKILLEFQKSKVLKFSTIEASAKISSSLNLNVVWDAIHTAVRKSSSYDSLMPLYGHFTEPYPKFSILKFQFDQISSKKEKIYLEIIQKMSEFSFLSNTYPLKSLSKNIDDVLEAIKKLRENNFDIRTHETNRAIQDGYFKPCYPFSLPTNTNSYVIWRSKGSHLTGDLKIKRDGNDLILDKVIS